jgi:hypothetical protein
MPDETRTTAPASLTSIPDAVDAARGTVVAGMASLTIGTKLGVVVVPATLGKSWRIARRQPKTCCEQICQRRATSDTRSWHQGLRDNPGLLIRRPAPPATRSG